MSKSSCLDHEGFLALICYSNGLVSFTERRSFCISRIELEFNSHSAVNNGWEHAIMAIR